MPEPRVIDAAAIAAALPYHAPMPGWHAHGKTLIPTDSCAACAELQRRHQLDVGVGE